jgi:uncharacterized protein (TIGR04222 family)
MWLLFLLVAWVAAAVSCGRLCLVAAAVAGARVPDTAAGAELRRGPGALTLYEAAFLSGGPQRVTDLALVSMSRQRRLVLAYTGWATVVDPVGRDDLERSVISAIGPGGACRVPAIRRALATADPVRVLGDRLTAAGLAVPDASRKGVTSAVRQVQGACLLVLLAAAAAVAVLPSRTGLGPAMAWFALPLVLTTGTLTIARLEIHPYSDWASPAGQLLLRRLETSRRRRRRAADDDQSLLTTLAVRGRAALADPDLRAALSDTLRGQRF